MGIALGIMTLIIFGLIFGSLLLYMFCLPKAIHIFQQESYQVKDYFRWLNKNPKQAFFLGVKELGICLGFGGIMFGIGALAKVLGISGTSLNFIYHVQLLLFYIVFYVAVIKLIRKWKKERRAAKKKLVYTARVKRLIFSSFFAALLVAFSLTDYATPFYASKFVLPELSILLCAQIAITFICMIFTMPVVLILGNLIIMPTETLIGDYYIGRARWKIIRPKFRNLIRIGITGSYGKTSTKFILKTILSEKYNVLATPESYNTTMGNVKIIRNELKPEHEVFISEMGARYRGDIRKICDFVYPQIGIITSIGPQHLESFKKIENVARTKAELLKAIPRKNENTVANMYMNLGKNSQEELSKCAIFLPNDGGECKKLFDSENERQKFSYGLNDKHASVYAKNIKMSSKGCEFTAVTSIGDIKCVSKLLGEHNIQNILGAISIAVFLGLSKEQIARGISKIEPIEHRLQLLANPNGSIVIDDAFNSNPVGSKMALDVLKSFDGRKIVITPGMVELGEKEEEFNKEFGRHMANCTDIAILVGIKRSKPIETGLIEKGFNKMNIFVVADLNAATQKLAEVTRPGDVILFENDLPDNYNE